MKKNIFSLAILTLLVTVLVPLVHADEKEAGEAAKLSAFTASEAAEFKTDDLRVKKLEAYLQHYHSPMSPYAHIFVEEADRQHLDWKLLVAISGVESTFGQFVPTGSYNPFGWGVFTGKNYGISFKGWDDAIASVSGGLKTNYVDKGATTVEQIGYLYASSPAWSNHVHFFMNDLDSFALPQDAAGHAIAMTL